MTETGDTAGGAGDDTPTPSQGIPQVPAPGTGPSPAIPDVSGAPGSVPAGPDTPSASGTPGTPGSTTPSGTPGSFAPPDSSAPPGGQWQPPNPPPYGAAPPYAQGLPQFQGGAAGWSADGLGKPGVIALRPLSLGDILDGAITAIRRYPLLILGSSAVIAVITAGLTLLVQLLVRTDTAQLTSLGAGATPQELQDATLNLLGSTLLVALPTALITLITRSMLAGFLTVVMGKAVLGRPVTFGTALREAGPRLLPLLGVTIVYGIACGVAALACILPFVIPFAFWGMAGPALVLERSTFGQSFSRSNRLVSGSFWRVLGIMLLAGAIGVVLNGIISVPFSIGSGAFSGLFDPQHVVTAPSTGSLLLTSVGSVIAQTITTPFVALVTVLVYIDQRMRKEGMDIELARAAGLPTPPRPSW